MPSGELQQLLAEATDLARRYRKLTGRPLGVTGEVAEYWAATLLNLDLAGVRQEGFDAWRGNERIQIKGRRLAGRKHKPGERMGSIRLDKEWDSIVLVLLDPDFEPFEIYEAGRPEIEQALTAPGSRARNERGQLAISKFKSVGRLVWHEPSV